MILSVDFFKSKPLKMKRPDQLKRFARVLKLTLLVLLPATIHINAQSPATVWYFGSNAGIDFSSGGPVALTNGAMSAGEGCASVSDASGNVLFYTNGTTVYDATHNPMPNGTGLMGNFSSTESAAIAPMPGTCNKFYVFTVDANQYESTINSGLRYSIVDMSLNSGLGDVTATKNIPMQNGAFEKLAIVKHQNGTDFWVVTNQVMTTSYNAYLLSTSGVSPIPVTTNIGFSHGSWALGYLAFSPNGTKAAVAISESQVFELMDFNNSTGVFSNLITLTPSVSSYTHYGVCFSPDGSKLYCSTIGNGSGSPSHIYQYDLSSGVPATIIASQYLVSVYTVGAAGYHYGGMRVAADNKMYVAKYYNSFISSIDSPNSAGVACNFVENSVNLGGPLSILGLPHSILGNQLNVAVTGPTTICVGDTVTLAAIGGTSFTWNTGDTISTVSVSPAATTQFSVIVSAGACYDTAYHTISVTPAYTANITGLDTICSGVNVTLHGSGGGTYLWNNSSTIDSIVVTPTSTTSYTLIVGSGTCADTAAFTINVVSAFSGSIAGSDSVCSGASTTLIASGGGSYLWSTGATTSTLNVTPATTSNYSVIVGTGSCADTVVHTVSVLPSFNSNITGLDTICSGNSTSLTASGSGPFVWSTGGNTATITSTPVASTNYFVIAGSGMCADTAFHNVVVNALPVVNIVGTDSICSGSSTILNASGANLYLWSNGGTTSTISPQPTSTTTYSIIGTNNAGCTATASHTIVVLAVPSASAGTDITICAGTTIQLQATGGGSYQWTNNTVLSNYLISDPLAIPFLTTSYIVTISNGFCSDMDTVVVTVNPIPVAIVTGSATILLGDNLVLTANGGGTYLWDNGSTDSILAVAPQQTTTYCVIVQNASSCADTACATIEVVEESSLYIPNCFTPNGDQNNQTFITPSTNIVEFHIMIFDRWGQLLYESNDVNAGWDATFKGSPVQEDVYVYVASAKGADNRIYNRTGHVSVIR